MTTTKKSIATEVANEVAANKSVLAQNIDAIKAAVTTEFCEPDGRVKSKSLFVATVDEESKRTWFGRGERHYAIKSTENPEGFAKFLERLGYDEAVVYQSIPPKRTSIFRYSREADENGKTENRFVPVIDIAHWRTAQADLTDDDRAILRELYDSREGAEIIRDWQVKHEATQQPSSAAAIANTAGFTI